MGLNQVLALFPVQFVYPVLVLLQMLAQHDVHITSHRDFPSGDVIHDFEYLVVDVTADIDALPGLDLVAQEKEVIVISLAFPAAAFLARLLLWQSLPCHAGCLAAAHLPGKSNRA